MGRGPRAMVAEWEQRRRSFAALEASFSAIRAEFEELRGEVGAGWEAERQAPAGRDVAGLEGERDLALDQLEKLQAEVEGLRRQNAELAGRGAEAETRSMALELRLGPLEERASRGIEQENHLEERLRGLEDPEAVHSAIGGNSSDSAIRTTRSGAPPTARPRSPGPRLRPSGRLSSIQQAIGDHESHRGATPTARPRSPGPDSRASGRIFASIRQAVNDREGRRVRLESASARLEASGLERGRDVNALREKLETGYAVVREEIEKLHELLQQVVNHHAERHGRLERSLDRLDPIESERASLRHEQEHLRQEQERFRLEQDATRRELLAQSERSRSEVAGLRAELEAWKSSLSPAAEASGDPRPNSVDTHWLAQPHHAAPLQPRPTGPGPSNFHFSPRSRRIDDVRDGYWSIFGTDDTCHHCCVL